LVDDAVEKISLEAVLAAVPERGRARFLELLLIEEIRVADGEAAADQHEAALERGKYIQTVDRYECRLTPRDRRLLDEADSLREVKTEIARIDRRLTRCTLRRFGMTAPVPLVIAPAAADPPAPRKLTRFRARKTGPPPNADKGNPGNVTVSGASSDLDNSSEHPENIKQFDISQAPSAFIAPGDFARLKRSQLWRSLSPIQQYLAVEYLRSGTDLDSLPFIRARITGRSRA
jgi:hypothetical protein